MFPEKLNRDLDNLTPLDARNSLLMDSSPLSDYKGRDINPSMSKAPLVSTSLHTTTTNNSARYDPVSGRDVSPPGYERGWSRPRGLGLHANDSHDGLISGAASMGGRDQSQERSQERAPRLPDVDFGHAY